jgi:chromosomal replication initiator protein
MKHELKAHLLTIHGEEEVHKWFDPLSIRAENGAIEIDFPHQYFADWFLSHYSETLTECLHTLFGSHVQVNYRCGTPPATLNGTASQSRLWKRDPGKDQFGSEFTFERFILSKKNYFPWISAKEISNISQIQYNPFLVCGEPSTGKTHLIRAIANQIAKEFPAKRIYLGDVEHLNGLYRSSGTGTLEVREELLESDVFILDDIQKLTKHVHLQDELVTFFDSFLARRCPMVFASQGKVSDLEALTEPLFSRFNLGLIVSVDPPDLNIRSKFVKQQCALKDVPLTKEQVFTLAQKFQDLRKLQGIILKLHAYKMLVSDQIDDNDFRHVVDHLGCPTGKPITWDVVVRSVAEFYGIPHEDILSTRRNGPIVKARQVALFLCRELLGLSYPKLGSLFGGRDHSTALHAVKKITKLQDDNPQMNKEIEELRQNCIRFGAEGGTTG